MRLVVAETVIAPSLDGLYRRYPNLHIELCVDDRLCASTRSDNVALILMLARAGVGVGRVMDLLAAPREVYHHLTWP